MLATMIAQLLEDAPLGTSDEAVQGDPTAARQYQTRWSDTPVGFGVGAALIWVSLQLG